MSDREPKMSGKTQKFLIITGFLFLTDMLKSQRMKSVVRTLIRTVCLLVLVIVVVVEFPSHPLEPRSVATVRIYYTHY